MGGMAAAPRQSRGARGTLGDRWRRRLRWLLTAGPAIAWMAVIYFGSADPDSGERSGEWLRGFLGLWSREFASSLTTLQLEALNQGARKAAHFAEYLVLTLLLARWFAAGRSSQRARALLLAPLVAVVYALTDEAHQAIVPGRSASMMDVVVDSLGAVTGAAIGAIAHALHVLDRRLAACSSPAGQDGR